MNRGQGHYRMKAKRGQLQPAGAAPHGHKHKIQSPEGMISQRLNVSVSSANLPKRPNTLEVRNPGRK
jgi:hypothetical protein